MRSLESVLERHNLFHARSQIDTDTSTHTNKHSPARARTDRQTKDIKTSKITVNRVVQAVSDRRRFVCLAGV